MIIGMMDWLLKQLCKVDSAQSLISTGELIIAGGFGSNEVKVFYGNTLFKPQAQIRDLSRATFTVDFSSSEDMFAMAGGDGVIRIFNVANEVKRFQFRKPIFNYLN